MRCSRRGRLSSERWRSLVDNDVEIPDRRGGGGALAEPHPRFERLRVEAVQVKCCHSIEPALTEGRRQTGHAVAVALDGVRRSLVAGSPSGIPRLNVDAEKAVLGAMLLSRDALAAAAEIGLTAEILAGELDVPVTALSQISRNVELRADKRPTLADLRESGALEADSDVVLLLYRDGLYNDASADRVSEVAVAKQCSGPREPSRSHSSTITPAISAWPAYDRRRD